jgi:hypothetical protein
MGDIILSGSGPGGSGGGTTVIVDGTNSAIEATVLDLVDSNPLTVAIVDANGDQISSFGGGTQYAEDTPSTAGEIITMAGVVRQDTRGTLVSNDGDRTELQVNSSGDLRVDGSAVTQPASIAAGSDVTEGNTTDAAVITDTTGTISGKLRGLVKWAFERMPASLGQKAMAASFPVVIASDQSAVPVSGTVTANQGGAPWSVNQTQVGGAALTLGQKTMANSEPVVLASDQTSIPVAAALADATATGILTGGGTVSVNTPGASTVFVYISGVWSGILNFESQMPDGTWVATYLSHSFGMTSSGTMQTQITSGNGFSYIGNVNGVAFRCFMSGFTSGSCTINIVVKPGARTFNALLTGAGAGSTQMNPVDVDNNRRLLIGTLPNGNTMPFIVNTADGASRGGSSGFDPVVSAFPWVFNGSNYDRLRGDATNGAFVNVKAAVPISTKTDLTPSAPAAASVGVASASAVAANANRKGLVLVNSSNARISLGFGSAAVLDSGITLYPGGVYEMDEFTFDLGQVNAIASAAASNLSIQEYAT